MKRILYKIKVIKKKDKDETWHYAIIDDGYSETSMRCDTTKELLQFIKREVSIKSAKP